ncbi:MAG: hypothetical protein GY943_18575, partial [Chloroflexi bacterium]|nr:hypothetical protein [Chloroflexota bacterium]
MAVITTGTHPKLLWPGLQSIFGLTYNDIPAMGPQCFEQVNSTQTYEEDQELTGFGLAPVKPESGGISYDTTAQGFIKRYTNVVYGLGFIETRESVEDNQYKGRATSRTKALARSMRTTKETVSANVLNRGFNSSYVGGDGVEFLSTAHPTKDGTQSNELAVAADLSESSLEDIFIQMMNATDSRGLRLQLKPQNLIVPSNLAFEATRIVKSNLQNDTANNAINAVKSMGILPQGVMVWQYLTDTDAWFVKSDCPDGMKFINRRSTEFTQDGDFDTDNFKHKATMRFDVGWTNWRSLYGSPGA